MGATLSHSHERDARDGNGPACTTEIGEASDEARLESEPIQVTLSSSPLYDRYRQRSVHELTPSGLPCCDRSPESAQKVRAVGELFNAIDADRDGAISPTELTQWARQHPTEFHAMASGRLGRLDLDRASEAGAAIDRAAKANRSRPVGEAHPLIVPAGARAAPMPGRRQPLNFGLTVRDQLSSLDEGDVTADDVNETYLSSRGDTTLAGGREDGASAQGEEHRFVRIAAQRKAVVAGRAEFQPLFGGSMAEGATFRIGSHEYGM